ncbi:MAG: Crp/Fnr family transcriptional regulator [Acidimicrobiales bacterium]
MADKLALLRGLNLFEEMTADEVNEISRHLRMCEVAAGSLVGGTSDLIYLLKVGRVRLYRLTESGEQVTTAVLGPGQLFGLSALDRGVWPPTLAEALEPSLICEAGAQDFVGLLGKHPLLMAKVLIAMARQVFRLEQTVESLVLDTVEERLASLLLTWLETAEPLADGALLPPRTQEEMAKLIAATRESVARTLSLWRQQGILRMQGRRIVVTEPCALAAKAAPRAV